MTESPHRAVISRLSADFATISQQLARASADLTELDRLLSEQPQPAAQPQATPYVPPAVPYWPQYPTPYAPRPYVPPPPPPVPPKPRQDRSEGWIGKVLAVAGVAVTLIGVVLLLVLAAQAGILRPEFRVAGGAVLAMALVATAWWLSGRPGGRVGAIALAATGVAAAYIDVIAVTTIYHWVPAPLGLVIAAVIGGGGLTLARRWDSQHLGLLVLVPLIVLAPVVTDGITLLLVGFMLALTAASLPVQLGKDWIWLHASRTAASTVPLLVALAGVYFDDGRDLWLAGACGIAAVLAVAGALILLPRMVNRAAMALLTAAGVVPVLSVSLAVDRVVAASMAAALAAALLAIVLTGLPGVTGVVRQIWSALSAISVLIAVTVAFDGYIAGPVLLAMSVVVAIAGRRDEVARWAAIGFACRRRRHLRQLRPAEHIGGSDRDDRRCGHLYIGREPAAGGIGDHDRVVVEVRLGAARSRCLGGCGSGDRVRRHRVHRHRRCAGGRRQAAASSQDTWRRRSAGSRWRPRCSATRRA